MCYRHKKKAATLSFFFFRSVSKLQSFLLQHQTFLEKCETWMEFLVQTEQKLAVEISGNYQHLLEQQRAHEVSYASTVLADKTVRPLEDAEKNAMWKKDLYCAPSLLKCMQCFCRLF